MIGKNRSRCFLDIDIENEHVGRVIIELFDDICPITCENFRFLCTGEKGFGQTTKKPLHYKNTLFHRVVKNFVIQGGDFVHGDGRGGESIYGGQFNDENFTVLHDQPFMLSMANRGKDSNGSQFFITTQAAPHLDGSHTVFGKVISGKEVVSLIENVATDSSNRPVKDVKISNSGEMVLQIKQKEKKKKREYVTESSESASDSDEKDRKKKKKRKHSKKHKREKKDRKALDSPVTRENEELCGLDPEEIPSIPMNKFLLRNTSPLPEANRRNSPRVRESYSYHRKPSRSKSGRKIKGRGFMRYRTPSPTGSRSGSETPPHWKQEQSKLRKMPEVITKKEIASGDSESHEEMDEESAIRNSMLQNRLGMSKKDDTRGNYPRKISDAMENPKNKELSTDEYRSLKERKHMMFKQFLNESEERYSENKFQTCNLHYDEAFHVSPLRSKIVKSREYDDKFSDHRQERDTDRKHRNEFIAEKKSSDSRFEQRHPYSVTNQNKNTLQKDGKENNSKRKSEHSFKNSKRYNILKNDLLKCVNPDFYKDNESPMKDKIVNKNIEIKKSDIVKPQDKKKTINESLKRHLLKYFDSDFKSNSEPPKKKKIVNKDIEPREREIINSQEKEQEVVDASSFEKTKLSTNLDVYESSALDLEKNANSLPVSESFSPNLLVTNKNSNENKFDMHTNLEDETTVVSSVQINAVNTEDIGIPSVSDKLISSSSVEDSAINKSVDHDSCVDNLDSSSEIHCSPSQNQDSSKEVEDCRSAIAPLDANIHEPSTTLFSTIKCVSPVGFSGDIQSNELIQAGGSSIQAKEKKFDYEEQHVETQQVCEKPKSEHLKSPQKSLRPQTPPTPDFSIKLKKKSPNRKCDKSSRSRSSSPVKKRRSSNSPERIASSSKRRRSPVDRKSKSPIHKLRSTPNHRTSRSTVARNSQSRSRSRSRRNSASPRDRSRRRQSRSHGRRSRSRPRIGRGSLIHRYQNFRNRSPDRRNAYYRQYNSPSYRGRIKRGSHRSRSRSLDRRRQRQRRSSSSSASSSSRNSSSSASNAKKKKSYRERKKHRSSSSSSSSSSKDSRSDSRSP